MSNNPLVWTDDRCAELEDLRFLLREASSINDGSGCLDRIARCIEIADKLLYGDYNLDEDSFYHFLHDLAIKNRTEFKGE